MFLCAPQDFTIAPRIVLSISILLHQTNVLWWSGEQQWLGIRLKEAHTPPLQKCHYHLWTTGTHCSNSRKEPVPGLCLNSALACSLLRDRKIPTEELQWYNSSKSAFSSFCSLTQRFQLERVIFGIFSTPFCPFCGSPHADFEISLWSFYFHWTILIIHQHTNICSHILTLLTSWALSFLKYFEPYSSHRFWRTVVTSKKSARS